MVGTEDAEKIQTNMSYPDARDHKEIVISSSSSSATGQERKEIYNFGFDRVARFLAMFDIKLIFY